MSTAREWLLERMLDGNAVIASDVLAEGQAAGHSHAALLAARRKLPILMSYQTRGSAGLSGPGRLVLWCLQADAAAAERKARAKNDRLATLEGRLETLAAQVVQLEGRLAELDFLR